jgi:hypothetical protein
MNQNVKVDPEYFNRWRCSGQILGWEMSVKFPGIHILLVIARLDRAIQEGRTQGFAPTSGLM